jgi:hypothetical protein
VKRAAALWAGYEQRVREENPLAAYARLHKVVPVALVALVGFLLVGIALPHGRQQEDAAILVEEPSRRAYAQVLERAFLPLTRGSERKILKIRREGARELLTLARASGLRNCRWDPVLTLRGGVTCDGRKLRDEALKAFFWVGLIVSALCLLAWLFVQLLDSWMLPVWNSRLWYTPIYSSVIGLITCGPFVMAATYFHRAGADYHVPPAEWFPATPGMQLYLLMVLQATAAVIATVEERPRAEYFATGAAMLIGVGLLAYLLLAVGQLGRTSTLTVLVGLEVILGALVLLGRRFIRASEAGQWLSRIFDLSRLLWVAWALFVGHAVLDELGVGAGYLGLAFAAVIYACLLLHLMASQRSELELSRATE